MLLWTAPDYGVANSNGPLNLKMSTILFLCYVCAEDDITVSEVTLQDEEEVYPSREQTPVPQLTTTEAPFAPTEIYTELDKNVVRKLTHKKISNPTAWSVSKEHHL